MRNPNTVLRRFNNFYANGEELPDDEVRAKWNGVMRKIKDLFPHLSEDGIYALSDVVNQAHEQYIINKGVE